MLIYKSPQIKLNGWHMVWHGVRLFSSYRGVPWEPVGPVRQYVDSFFPLFALVGTIVVLIFLSKAVCRATI